MMKDMLNFAIAFSSVFTSCMLASKIKFYDEKKT